MKKLSGMLFFLIEVAVGCSVLLALALLGGCDFRSTSARDYRFDAVAAVATIDPAEEEPEPDVGPKVGDVCPNCNGTGKVGDGTVMVPCAVCGGDGRIDEEDLNNDPDPQPEPDPQPVAEEESAEEVEYEYEYQEPRRFRLFRGRLFGR